MKTDRELLELAAKAAGYDFNWRGLAKTLPSIGRGTDQKWWNPLTDDGDALRLAVKLGLTIVCHSQGKLFLAIACKGSFNASPNVSEKGSDPNAATRRAIVRAAAAIGEAQP